MSERWTDDDTRTNAAIRHDYFITLARVEWAAMSPRRRRRLMRREPLVYSIIKALADEG